MTGVQQRGWEQFFQLVRDVKARLSVARLDVSGGTADAQITGTYTYLNTSTGRTESQPVSFHAILQKRRRAVVDESGEVGVRSRESGVGSHESRVTSHESRRSRVASRGSRWSRVSETRCRVVASRESQLDMPDRYR